MNMESFPPKLKEDIIKSASPKFEEELFCSLANHRLSEQLYFEAISYTWDESVFPRQLLSPKGHLRITENLATTLTAMRLESEPRYLWVDVSDKLPVVNVVMMDKIYKAALSVSVYLRTASDNTADAIASIRRITSTKDRFEIEEIFHAVKKTAQSSGWSQSEENAFRHLVSTTNFDQLVELYNLSWFKRAWIVQEVTVPKILKFVWRTSTLSYEDFSFATAVPHSLLHTFTTTARNLEFNHIEKAWDLVNTRLACWRQREQDLDLLSESAHSADNIRRPTWQSIRMLDYVQTMDRECSDPRDKIYALLSLRSEKDIALIPDYNKSVAEVFADFARAYLKCEDMKILHQAGVQRIASNPDPIRHFATRSLQDEFPSWTPDWRVRLPYLDLGGSSGEIFTTATNLHANIQPDISSAAIYIAGFKLDIVNHRQGVLDLGEHSNSTLRYTTHENLRASILDLYSFYSNHQSGTYLTREDLLTVFARTIMADGCCALFEGMLPHWSSPSALVTMWQLYLRISIKPDNNLYLAQDVLIPNPQTGGPSHERAQNIRTAWLVMAFMFAATKNRCLIITDKGYVGLSPSMTEAGDVVAILEGAETPFILRPTADEGVFRLLGDCYLHGVMHGELVSTKELEGRMGQLTIV